MVNPALILLKKLVLGLARLSSLAKKKSQSVYRPIGNAPYFFFPVYAIAAVVRSSID